MKKKIFVFLSVVGLCLFGLLNSFPVLAVTEKTFYKMIDFDRAINWNIEEINERTFTISVDLNLPDVKKDVDINEVATMYTTFAIVLLKGEPSPTGQRYKFELGDDAEEVRLLMSLDRDRYDTWCVGTGRQCSRDNITIETVKIMVRYNYFGYYLVDYAPSEVMKNFLRVEPNFDNGSLVGNWGEEKYYLYLDAYVYLPDGTKRSITIMPDLIDDYFDNFDFVVLAFNLSPRSRFWSSDIYPNESISGLSYIVYDLVANTTTYYDYQGNIVVQVNGLSYIDNPQFYIPETEALDYQLKASYEEGKTEGYRQGREEGERAGKRKMQEEMQQVINDLVEYYEQEIVKAYNRGRNEADFENLDMFGYLQALFGEQGLGRLLRLELLPGVSLGAVIMIPLAFWLVSFIMRWFR